MSAGHTPGPWGYRLEAVRTVIFHKTGIGERAIAVGAGHYPDHIANARLIAAAPDLLAALQQELEALEMDRRWAETCDLERIIARYDRLEAAIAKATGAAT